MASFPEIISANGEQFTAHLDDRQISSESALRGNMVAEQSPGTPEASRLVAKTRVPAARLEERRVIGGHES
jgi:hypothetical protein